MATLKCVHESKSEGRPNVIFVHGLNGDLEETWMYNKKDRTTLWPTWVGADADCSVWVLGYDAQVSGWFGGGMPLQRQGTSVLDRIASEPRLAGRALILVGHSLGGLVIKAAIVNGDTYGVERHQDVISRIAGVVFIATPHFGSGIANVVMAVGPLKWLVRINGHVGDLQARNEQLSQLNQQFRAVQKQYEFLVRSFSETLPVCFPKWYRFVPRVPVAMVVLPESAEPHIPSEVAIPLGADHFSIAKPKHRSEQIHVSLQDFIARVEHVSSTRPVSPGHSKIVAGAGEQLALDPVKGSAPDEKSGGVLIAPPRPTQVAVGEYGLVREQAGVAVTAYIATDSPSLLIDKISSWRQLVASDPLVPKELRASVPEMDLRSIFAHPETRAQLLDDLAVTPFSGYVYYGSVASFPTGDSELLRRAFFVEPLIHRMSKKDAVIEKLWLPSDGRLIAAVDEAKSSVASRFRRVVPATPVLCGADRRGSHLVEFAHLVAYAAGRYLMDRAKGGDVTVFEHLRTRIRFAQNVVTGERHKRDENPL